jgi:hypothetical protein
LDTKTAIDKLPTDTLPFLKHLALIALTNIRETESGLELFPIDNTLRENCFIAGYIEGYGEGCKFFENKDKKKPKPSRRIVP